MTSNSSNPGKSLSPSTAYLASSQQSASSTTSFESSSRVRSGQQAPSVASPRNSQGARRQHRNQRRPVKSLRPSLDDDELAMAEYRAVSNASSRRGQTSITHLLDYSLSRPYQEHAYNFRRQPTWGKGSGYHPQDKAKYIHANYRFVLSPQATYTKEAGNADQHADWTNVLQIIASTESQSSDCPICLHEPVAPRMTKCGHIFCLPCFIQYMNNTNEEEAHKKTKWKKCPICDDNIYTADVRPVRFYMGQDTAIPRPGQDVVLRLFMRHSNSTLALPKEGGAEVLNSGEDIPWHYAANVMDYARIMRGTAEYMTEQFDLEIEALKKQEQEDELIYNESNEFTQKAIRNINAAKESVQELKTETPAPVVAASGSRTKGPVCDYFFYTAPPHVYLSPLDIRILKAKYGTFSAFPSTLLPRVEHISTGHSMDDTLRKRVKYLGHLPRGCLVSFIECDWTDIIPDGILETFKPELERRRKRNRDKEVQEEKERAEAERIDSAEIRNMRRNMAFIDDGCEPDRPAFNDDDFQPLVPTATTTTAEGNDGGATASGAGGPTPPHSAAGPKTIWGTSVVQAAPSMAAEGLEGEQGLDVNDGWLKEEDVSEQALQRQIEALEVNDAGGSSSAADAPKGKSGGGKKKKKGKITLMTTGGRRFG